MQRKRTAQWLGCFLIVVCSLVGSQLHAQEVDPQKDKQIRELFRLTGVSDNMRSMMNTVFSQFKERFTQVPDEYWDYMSERLSVDTLIDLSVTVYNQHFTLEEINGLIAFYKTELGQTLIAKQPLISRELMVVGMDWGKAWGERIMLDFIEDDWRDESNKVQE